MSPRSEKFSNAWNFVHYWGGHLRNSHRVLGVGIASNKYLARHRVGDIVALTMPLSRIKVYRSSSYRIIRQLSEYIFPIKFACLVDTILMTTQHHRSCILPYFAIVDLPVTVSLYPLATVKERTKGMKKKSRFTKKGKSRDETS